MRHNRSRCTIAPPRDLGSLQDFIKICSRCTSNQPPSSEGGGCISQMWFDSQFHLTREMPSDQFPSDVRLSRGWKCVRASQDFLLMSDQSDDSAPLGGLGLDRILDVNLNLDLAAVEGETLIWRYIYIQRRNLEFGNSLAPDIKLDDNQSFDISCQPAATSCFTGVG